ncbi:glycosyltransferase family 2 protein [Luteolibacter pohnpeiensis]|uniref:Glycosyltransferase family 2 protein n=1 Tax=Luteolibacter pohnpeiensis TaxID=454153 RepID=A0A934S774_9BACT|nr:glycosyltransferase family A protein [Luteolibacter pohnpeiensis]MBK1882479.1 glycosyltransferase family 2 protein [Luteolibacter pohnpeiensis]
MHTPMVSIIIPCYNAEKHLKEAIQCALDQTWGNKEIIVIDDGSIDSSLRIIQSFGDRVIYRSGANQGGNHARNLGAKISKGDYLQFLDADDFMDAEKIEKQMIALSNAPPGTIAGCAWQYHFCEKPPVIPVAKFWKNYTSSREMILDQWLGQGFLAPHCWLIPKEIWHKIGGWDETLKADQDGNFFGKVLLADQEVCFINEVLASYRMTGASSVSRQNSKEAAESRFRSWKALSAMILSNDSTSKAKQAVCCWGSAVARGIILRGGFHKSGGAMIGYQMLNYVFRHYPSDVRNFFHNSWMDMFSKIFGLKLAIHFSILIRRTRGFLGGER